MSSCKTWGVPLDIFLELKCWFQDQTHLPQNTPDEYLLMMVHSCYLDMEKTKKTIEVYFRLKSTTPQLFSGRSLDVPNILKVSQSVPVAMLPSKTDDGYSIIWGWIEDPSPSSFLADVNFKLSCMVMDVVIRENPGCPGLIIVYDTSHFSFKHLIKLSFRTLAKYFEYFQEACPVRIMGAHVLNVSSLIIYTEKLSKPFLKNESRCKTLFYTSRDFDKFVENSKIGLDNIPKEFGGRGPSKYEMIDETLKKIKAHSEWFKFDETLRIKC